MEWLLLTVIVLATAAFIAHGTYASDKKVSELSKTMSEEPYPAFAALDESSGEAEGGEISAVRDGGA